MWRRVFTIFAGASLLLCVAVCVMWVRSADTRGRTVQVAAGGIWFRASQSRDGVVASIIPGHPTRWWASAARADDLTTPEPFSLGTTTNEMEWRQFGFHWGTGELRVLLQDDGSDAQLQPGGSRNYENLPVLLPVDPGWPYEGRWSPPLKYYWILNVEHWKLIVFTALIPAVWLAGALRAARMTRVRTRAGRCPACGYDLRATPGRCPECGAVPVDA